MGSGKTLILEPTSEFGLKLTIGSDNMPRKAREAMSADDIHQAMGDDYKVHKEARMWAMFSNGYVPCERALDELPPGQYVIQNDQSRGIHFVKKEVKLDELYMLPDSSSEKVIKALKEFWKSEDKYRKYNFTWKRGALLWGPPGSGKTSTVQLLADFVVNEMHGIAVYVNDPFLGAVGLELIRKIEPHRPMVVMLEDLDAIISNDRFREAALLSLLDGELQIDNVCFIATTNYPEDLDKRITNRPSRFDIMEKIGMPSPEARKVYINAKFPEVDNIERWVEKTEGFSLAHIKELIISVEVFGYDFDATVERLTGMNTRKVTSEDNVEKKFGFN